MLQSLSSTHLDIFNMKEKDFLDEIIMSAAKALKSKKGEKMEKRKPEIQNVVAMGIIRLKTGEKTILNIA